MPPGGTTSSSPVEHRLLEEAGAAIVGLDADMRVVRWNPAAERLSGWSAAEAAGRPVLDLMGSLPGGSTSQEALAVLGAWGEWRGEGHFRRKDGSELPVEIVVRRIASPSGAVEGFVAVAIDASARKKGDGALRRSQEQIRFQALLLEQVNDSVIAVDDRRDVLYWNKGAERTYGWSAEEAIGRSVDEMITIENGGVEERKRMLAQADAEGTYAGEQVVRHRDGRLLTLELSVSRVRDSDGRPIGYVSIARDVTDRRRIQEALVESEERYRTLFDVSPDAALVHAGGKVLYANPAALRMFGAVVAEELVGRSVLEIVHPDDREKVRARIAAIVERSERAPLTEERLVRRDGSILLAEVAAAPLRFDGRPAILAVARDVSRRAS